MARRLPAAMIVSTMVVTPVALAKDDGSGRAVTASASGVKAQLKKLKKLTKQVWALRRQVAELATQPGPQDPQGAAGPPGAAGPQGPAGPATVRPAAT